MINTHTHRKIIYIKLYFNLDMDLLNAFIEEKLEMFIKNMKEFLSEPAVLAPMFRVLEIVACAEGKTRGVFTHDLFILSLTYRGLHIL